MRWDAAAKGLRWNTSQQLAETCKQGWTYNPCELLLEEWEGRRKADRVELPKEWVEKLPDSRYVAQHCQATALEKMRK